MTKYKNLKKQIIKEVNFVYWKIVWVVGIDVGVWGKKFFRLGYFKMMRTCLATISIKPDTPQFLYFLP